MRRVFRTALAASLLLALSTAGARQPTAGGDNADLRLYRNLPQDPLLVIAVSVDDLNARLDGLLSFVGSLRSGAGDVDAFGGGLARLRTVLGFSIEEELLPYLGPEIAVAFDLPPIDQAVAALHYAGAETQARLLGGTGIVARVRNAKKLERGLHLLFTRLGGELTAEKGVMRVTLPLDGAAPDGARAPSVGSILSLHYAVGRDRLALGFARDWVLSSRQKRPRSESLVGGADFAKVFAHLDSQPSSLTYVNLPKLRELFAGSAIMRALYEENAEVREIVQPLLRPDVMKVGLGSTTVPVEGGVRTTNFGPSWMSGPAMSGGLLAALTIPNLLVASEEGKTRQTLTDIHSIAVACEGFSEDARSYPGPTKGWVNVDKIANFLEPVYISSLPRDDAWHHPILYWSDGQSYRILSLGKDGLMDKDWSGIVEPIASTQIDGDIVFGDGRFIVIPNQIVSE